MATKAELPVWPQLGLEEEFSPLGRAVIGNNPITNNFTTRPWVAGGTLSEGDESEEENVEKLQGIIRSLL